MPDLFSQHAVTTPAPSTYGDEQNRLDWLRLIRSEQVGPRMFYDLLRCMGSARQALEALPELAKRGGRKQPIVIASEAQTHKEYAALTAYGATLIPAYDPRYPALLKHVEGHPPVITVFGDTRIWQRPTIAMVGARNASLNGCRLAASLAGDLSRHNMVLVSGLARGIDTGVHQATLQQGTIAVVAGGIDIIYPPENAKLYDAIAQTGAVIAEMPFGSPPKSQHFPLRNRIISGLSYGVVVVEATKGSGSLITARYALEQNREIFAVPGFPGDPRAYGTNQLIRDGAVLTRSAEDVLEVIRPLLYHATFKAPTVEFEPHVTAEQAHGNQNTAPHAPSAPPMYDAAEIAAARKTLLPMLSATPVDVDTLIRVTGYPVPLVLMVLLECELAGSIARYPGNQVIRIFDESC